MRVSGERYLDERNKQKKISDKNKSFVDVRREKVKSVNQKFNTHTKKKEPNTQNEEKLCFFLLRVRWMSFKW